MVRLLNFIRKSWCIKNNSTVACDYFNGGENSIMNARVGIDGRAAAAMVLAVDCNWDEAAARFAAKK